MRPFEGYAVFCSRVWMACCPLPRGWHALSSCLDVGMYGGHVVSSCWLMCCDVDVDWFVVMFVDVGWCVVMSEVL